MTAGGEPSELIYDGDCGFCTRSAIAANRHRLPGGTAACRIDEHRLQ